MSKLLTESQKKSLFRLLADDDLSTLDLVKRQLIEQGEETVPELERWLNEVRGTPAESHLVEVLGRLKNERCHEAFLQFCRAAMVIRDFDLEEASFLLSSTEYPAAEMLRYKKMLDQLAQEVRQEIQQQRSSSEIHAMSTVLHEFHHFRGNRERYYEAENTYLNRVIEREMGIPITLSIIYVLLGKRLDIPIHGVALPGHFIIRWKDQFFDPFNQGRPLTEKACQQMVENREQEFRPEYLNPATPHQVLVRMLMNLSRVYEIEEDRNRLARIRHYLKTLQAL
jgi:regulator of sirC expression with transglutaminase-like and TPR domain